MSHQVLGRNHNEEELLLPDDRRGKQWGFYLISAFSGSGKSLLLKNLINQNKEDYVIIFDFNGEHSMNNSPNIYSRDKNYSNFLPRLKTINNPVMNFKSFDKVSDWVSLNITENGAVCILQLLPYAGTFRELLAMVKDLPTKVKEVDEFYLKYGFKPPLTHIEIKTGVDRKLSFLSERVFNIKGDSIDNPYILLNRHKQICINLKMIDETQELKARFFVGKFLEKLIPNLKYFKGNLYIYFEEGDLLIPYPKGEVRCSSAEQIELLVTKWARRNKTRIFLITQFTERLDPRIVYKYSFIIKQVGRYDESKSWFKICDTKAVNTKYESGYWRTFYPLDCSSRYEGYPEIRKKNKKRNFP